METNKFIEVDYLPVGAGEKSGDAIAIRYGYLSGNQITSQKIIVIDGGTLEGGELLSALIKERYNVDTINLVISTHPDNDHCSGLRVIFSEFKVEELWLHRPWDSAEELQDLFHDGRITANSLSDKLKEGLEIAYEINSIAIKQGTLIRDPFHGLTFDGGIITILGPSEHYYKQLVAEFRCTPEPIQELMTKAAEAAKSVISWVKEAMHIETLDESGVTSAENNSSVITLFRFAEEKYLFTGDAGIPALHAAADYATQLSIRLDDLDLFDIPHHGSKHNVSPSVFDRIKGGTACISVAPKAPKHPAKKVINALIRRGAGVYSTEGAALLYHKNTPLRDGYNPATSLPFNDLVEA